MTSSAQTPEPTDEPICGEEHDTDEGTWACLVRNFDPVTGEHLPPVGKYAPSVTPSAASGVTRADGEGRATCECTNGRDQHRDCEAHTPGPVRLDPGYSYDEWFDRYGPQGWDR